MFSNELIGNSSLTTKLWERGRAEMDCLSMLQVVKKMLIPIILCQLDGTQQFQLLQCMLRL
jgi:hypothetical protein